MAIPAQVWAIAPWSAPGGVEPRPLGQQQRVVPIPTARTTRFSFLAGAGFDQLRGRDCWSATARIPNYPGGGIALSPLPEQGVMRLFAWWPDARRLFLIRQHADGSRWPVRGGTPRKTDGRTRRNGIQNPSCEVSLAGMVPGRGSPVLEQVARPEHADDDAGVYALRGTVASAGQWEIAWPVDPVECPSGSATVSVDVRTSSALSAVSAIVSWVDVVGNALGDTTTALSEQQLAAVNGVMRRVTVHTLAPDDATRAVAVKLYAPTVPAGGWLETDCAVLEDGMTDGAYVAGSTPGGQWVGTPDLSASIIAPVQVIVDRECPLDQRVRYEVFYTGMTGGRMRSAWETLYARRSRYSGWITHPLLPDVVPLWVPRDFDLTRAITREKIDVQGRPNPIVLTDGTRRSGSGTFTAYTEGLVDRHRLTDLLADGAPLCVRFPAGYDHPPLWWLSFSDVTVTNPRGDAPYDRREFSAPFDPVDPPSAIDYQVA